MKRKVFLSLVVCITLMAVFAVSASAVLGDDVIDVYYLEDCTVGDRPYICCDTIGQVDAIEVYDINKNLIKTCTEPEGIYEGEWYYWEFQMDYTLQKGDLLQYFIRAKRGNDYTPYYLLTSEAYDPDEEWDEDEADIYYATCRYNIGEKPVFIVNTYRGDSVEFYDASKKLIATVTEPYDGDTEDRYWKLTLNKTVKAGDYDLIYVRVKSSYGYSAYWPIYGEAKQQIPAIYSVSTGLVDDIATQYEPFTITVETSAATKYLEIWSYDNDGNNMQGAWGSDYVTGNTSNGTLIWTIPYMYEVYNTTDFGFEYVDITPMDDSMELTFDYCWALYIHINKAGKPVVSSAKFNSAATVGTPVNITVKTSVGTRYLAMCDSTGNTVYATWKESSSDGTWNVSYTFSGAGKRTMYFKTSYDKQTWSTPVSATVTVNAAAPKITSAKFDSAATVGKAVGITVTTPTSAKYIAMCSSNGAAYKTWSSGYTDSNGVRTWKVNYTFSGSGNRTMYFKASADNSNWGALVSANVTVNKAAEAAKVNSAKFDSSATVGKAVGITVTTTTSAKYIAMCSSNGAAYKTWTSGYTDSNGVRTWKVNYTFSGSGNRTMYFKASADNSTWSSLVSATVTVNKAAEAAKVNSAKFDSAATVGKPVGITVTTNTSAKYIAMCSSNGAAYKTWTSGYTDSNGVRTWKVNYTFSGSGNRTMYFKASADNNTWSALVSATVTVNKAAAEPKINSAVFNSDAIVGQSVGITVKTTTSVKYVRMYSEGGSAVKTWSSGYTDSGDVRTWKLSYSFGGAGYRSITFKGSADNSSYSAGVVAKVSVNPAVPTVSSAAFAASSAKVNQSVGITVKTSSNATTLALCSESGSIVKTWSASGNSSVSGNVRTWNVSYSFGGAGSRSIGFKASANGSTYGSAVKANITITK